MERERWQQLERVCQAALDHPQSERAAFLEAACAGDEALRQEAEALLAHETQAKNYLEVPPLEAAKEVLAKDGSGPAHARPTSDGTADEPGPNASGPGTVLDHYHLLQKVGEGGMGEVWLAEQREPVRRRVALKLVKAGRNTREVMARFESERQALALMDHPAIAKVFDAGSTPQGAPYFVMEYVAGVPITAYCDNHRLSTRERLELFMHVCEGVQHAHQKAIIHRDLKPSNILVTEVDGRAAPKIIDFGVAKALSQRLTAQTLYTRAGALVGTPEYMSPEQALSSGEDIDTRTDVYSLGVIFYELLAGVPPIELRKVAFDEFLRRLLEEEPPKPSTKIRTQHPATFTEVARQRQTEPPTLVRQLRGDLDSIALKGLEKDRSRRYGSPSDLAADIGRFLRNEAVLAVPPSVAYRTRKFARRYRAALVTVAAFMVVVIAAAVVSIQQSLRATKERDRADTAWLAIQRRALEHSDAGSWGNLANLYRAQGNYTQAEAYDRQILETRRRVQGPEHPDTLASMNNLAGDYTLQDKFAQAGVLYSQALEISRRVLGPEHPNTLTYMDNVANAYCAQGKYAQAEALFRQTLEISRRVLGLKHVDTLRYMSNLANVYSAQGKYTQAEALFSQTLEISRRVLGPEHPDTLGTLSDFASMYLRQGKYALAETYHTQALAGRRHALGPEHPDTMKSAADLALAYQSQGKFTESEALAREALDFSRKKQQLLYSAFVAARMARISCRESAGRQPGWTEEIRRSRTAAARRLSGDGGTEGPHSSPGPLLPGPGPRMDCPTLPGLGQTGEGCRVEEEVRSTPAAFAWKSHLQERKDRAEQGSRPRFSVCGFEALSDILNTRTLALCLGCGA